VPCQRRAAPDRRGRAGELVAKRYLREAADLMVVSKKQGNLFTECHEAAARWGLGS